MAAATALAIAGSIVFVANIAAERNRADEQRHRAEQQQQRAEEQQQRAERANDELVLQNTALLMQRDPTAALAALAGYHGKDEVRKQMLRAEAEGRGVAEAVFTPHSDTIWFLIGRAGGEVFSLAEDRRIRLTRDKITTPVADDLLASGAHTYAPERGLLVYARTPDGVVLLDLGTQTAIGTIPTGPAIEMTITPDGTRLAVLDTRGKLTVWEVSPGPARTPLFEADFPAAREVFFAGPSHLIVKEAAAFIAVSLDPRQIGPTRAAPSLRSLHARTDEVVVGDESGQLTLLSRTLSPLATVQVCRRRVKSVRLAARARRAAFACQDGVAGIVEYDALRTALRVTGTFATEGPSLEARPDDLGDRVIARSDSNTAYLYDRSSRLTWRYEGHVGRVSAVAAPTADFEHVLVGDVNGMVRIWQVPPRRARVVLQAPQAVYGGAFSPDSKTLVTDGAEGIVRRITLADGTVTELRGHRAFARRTQTAPDGSSSLSYSGDGTIRIWGPTGAAPLHVFTEHGNYVGDAEYLEGGRRVASTGDNGHLLIWAPHPNPGPSVPLFTHPRGLPLHALEVLHHNGHIAVHDSAGALWDIAPGGATRQVRAADGSVITMLRASADGGLLAVGTDAGVVTVYQTTDYQVIHRLAAAASIRQIVFDPRNRDLLIASEDGHVRGVALSPGGRIPWRELQVAARDVAYSPDGEVLAFVCGDGGAWFHSFSADRWVYARDPYDGCPLWSFFTRRRPVRERRPQRGRRLVRDVIQTMTRRSR